MLKHLCGELQAPPLRLIARAALAIADNVNTRPEAIVRELAPAGLLRERSFISATQQACV